MYTKEDLESINLQFKHRVFLLLIPEVLLCLALIISFILRVQWLSVLLFCLMGAAALFAWGIHLSPLAAYRRYLKEVLTGRKREYIGRFAGFDQNEVIRDGVRFMPFMLNVAETPEKIDDRLLYFDKQFSPPSWQEGLRLYISTFDKSVVQWREEV